MYWSTYSSCASLDYRFSAYFHIAVLLIILFTLLSSALLPSILRLIILLFFFFNDTATTEIYTLSLHDALPISPKPTSNAEARATPENSVTTNRLKDIAFVPSSLAVMIVGPPAGMFSRWNTTKQLPSVAFHLENIQIGRAHV